MTIVATMMRGALSAYRAAVTLDGRNDFFQPNVTGSRGIELVGNVHATYEELYRTQIWVHAIVNRYARSIGRLPLKVFIDAGRPGERERVREGPLAELMAQPAPRWSPAEWKAAVVSNLMIHGNCVLVKIRPRPGRPVMALMPTSFAYWQVTQDRDGLRWYVFSPGAGHPMTFTPEDVVHLRWWAAGQGLLASSPLQALRTTLMMEDATQRMTIASFENGARPAGAYVVDGELKPDNAKAMREELNYIYAGVDNTAKIALLDRGAKWNPMSHNAVDSELINLRKLAREEVAAAYNMPASSVGILDRATFSNIVEQHLMEYMDAVQPVTALVEQTLQTQLIAAEPLMTGQYVEFDFNAVLTGDPVRRIEVLTKAVGGAYMTRNEARARENLPPIDTEEMDTVLTPTNNATPAGMAADGA